MILRNRFEDDLKLPNYIYRIKDKFTENKVISRLRCNFSYMKLIVLTYKSAETWCFAAGQRQSYSDHFDDFSYAKLHANKDIQADHFLLRTSFLGTFEFGGS